MPLDRSLQVKVRDLFPSDQWSVVESLLENECGQNLPLVDKQGEFGLNRIRAAVLKLSGGSKQKLKQHIEIAKSDWRDVLVAAKFADSESTYTEWLNSLDIRACTEKDFDQILSVVNDSAMAYKDTFPPQLYREPWMTPEYLQDEINRGVKFWGYEKNKEIVGVMGVQNVNDVILIRHSYIRSIKRRSGIGSKLIEFHKSHADRPVLVGCLKSMTWAISFYEKHGFSLVSDEIRDALRAKYWNLSAEHVRNSVVLVDRNWLMHNKVA